MNKKLKIWVSAFANGTALCLILGCGSEAKLPASSVKEAPATSTPYSSVTNPTAAPTSPTSSATVGKTFRFFCEDAALSDSVTSFNVNETDTTKTRSARIYLQDPAVPAGSDDDLLVSISHPTGILSKGGKTLFYFEGSNLDRSAIGESDLEKALYLGNLDWTSREVKSQKIIALDTLPSFISESANRIGFSTKMAATDSSGLNSVVPFNAKGLQFQITSADGKKFIVPCDIQSCFDPHLEINRHQVLFTALDAQTNRSWINTVNFSAKVNSVRAYPAEVTADQVAPFFGNADTTGWLEVSSKKLNLTVLDLKKGLHRVDLLKFETYPVTPRYSVLLNDRILSIAISFWNTKTKRSELSLFKVDIESMKIIDQKDLGSSLLTLSTDTSPEDLSFQDGDHLFAVLSKAKVPSLFRYSISDASWNSLTSSPCREPSFVEESD